MTSYPSTIRRVPAYLVFAAAAWLAPAAAVADCTTRAAKPAETAFHSRALSALVAALPPVPAGVQELEARPHDYRKPPAMREVLCDFSKEGAFSVTARRVYVRRHSEAERRHVQTQYDALTAQYHALRKTPAPMVERQNVLRQKSNDAWKAARDAEKAADKPGAQARDAEYRALRDEADAIDAQHQASVKPQTDELDKRRGALDLESQKVEVRLGMNLQRLPAAGSEPTRGAFGAASPGQSAGLKVHNVAFAVEGTEG
ncbi:MAG: hypothetical protein H7Y61_04185, partial [Rhizobiales bacterium]|nr:hypothetical protein [Rhizobacter sp.]